MDSAGCLRWDWGRRVDWGVTAKGSGVSLGGDETVLKFLEKFHLFY